MVTILQQHLRYTSWASQALLETAGGLSPDQLLRDFGTANKTLLGTLVHIFAADRLWLARVEGRPPARFVTEADHSLDVLRRDWPPLLDGWVRWASSLDDEAVRRELLYHDLKGREWREPLWQIVLHVVNHATHHRGQVSGFLRTMGLTPAPLDEIAFFRQQAPPG
jgi:uncharacterized damage-inducible protein DinB